MNLDCVRFSSIASPIDWSIALFWNMQSNVDEKSAELGPDISKPGKSARVNLLFGQCSIVTQSVVVYADFA